MVASGAGDENLKFWKVFEKKEKRKGDGSSSSSSSGDGIDKVDELVSGCRMMKLR